MQFDESKHPRDEDGKFTESGKTSPKTRDEIKQEISLLRDKLRTTRGSIFNPSKEREEISQKIGRLQATLDTMPNAKETKLTPIKNLEETKQEYMMSHRPTETGITADDLTNQNVETPMPKDFYDNWEKYLNTSEDGAVESMDVLRKIKGNPNAKITIYRATTGDSINDGDWITLSKTYADKHNASSLKGKGKVLSQVVSAKDIQWAGDSINEWGYFPKVRENAEKLFNMKFL